MVWNVSVCVVTQTAVILQTPSPSPRLGWLNICSWQPALGACGWPQWMKPCFCSPHLPLSARLSLSPFWRWNQTIVMLSSTAEFCQSDGALCSSLSCEWPTRRYPALERWATLSRVLQEEARVSQLPETLFLFVFSRGGWWGWFPQHPDRWRVSAQQQRQQRKMWVMQNLKYFFYIISDH